MKSYKVSPKHPRPVLAADEFGEDEFSVDEVDDMNGALADTIDNVAENVEDIQDAVDGIEEDDVNIEVENNISDHYIAECELCHGIFISATIESEQVVQKVTGECPLCGKESDQYLKWVIKSVNE